MAIESYEDCIRKCKELVDLLKEIKKAESFYSEFSYPDILQEIRKLRRFGKMNFPPYGSEERIDMETFDLEKTAAAKAIEELVDYFVYKKEYFDKKLKEANSVKRRYSQETVETIRGREGSLLNDRRIPSILD